MAIGWRLSAWMKGACCHVRRGQAGERRDGRRDDRKVGHEELHPLFEDARREYRYALLKEYREYMKRQVEDGPK